VLGCPDIRRPDTACDTLEGEGHPSRPERGKYVPYLRVASEYDVVNDMRTGREILITDHIGKYIKTLIDS